MVQERDSSSQLYTLVNKTLIMPAITWPWPNYFQSNFSFFSFLSIMADIEILDTVKIAEGITKVCL